MNRLKNTVFIVIVIMLFLPVLQNIFHPFKIKALHGAYIPAKSVPFTFHGFFTDTFQDPFNKYLEEHIGFHKLLVRLNNQIVYSLFRTARASEVVVGKNNCLYEKSYIEAYLGRDFIGKDSLDEKVRKIKFIQDELKKKGIDMIIIFAPGKATFFPEYIPDYFHPRRKSISNYEYLLQSFKEKGINYIDFNNYFILMKDSATYPLYPQCGIHWSAYGVAIAVDSIIHYIEHIKHLTMTDFGWNGFDVTNDLRTPDNDLSEGMNLLFDIHHYPMAYPKLYFKENTATYKPNVITMADSYYWNIFGTGIASRLFNANTFWYYFAQSYTPENVEGCDIKQVNVLNEIEKSDVIIYLSTDATLRKFAFGFEDKVYDLLKKEADKKAISDSTQENRIYFIEQVIRNDSIWFQEIKRKARVKNISVEEMLRKDAMWLYEKEKNQKK